MKVAACQAPLMPPAPYPVESPGDCNRHHVLDTTLLKRGMDITHVFDDQLILPASCKPALMKTGSILLKEVGDHVNGPGTMAATARPDDRRS